MRRRAGRGCPPRFAGSLPWVDMTVRELLAWGPAVTPSLHSKFSIWFSRSRADSWGHNSIHGPSPGSLVHGQGAPPGRRDNQPLSLPSQGGSSSTAWAPCTAGGRPRSSSPTT